MVPLLAYLFNFVTGNLLMSQRILSGLGCILLLYSLLYIMNKENYESRQKFLILLIFAISPWFFDSILSMHFDAISISIILLFTYKALKKPGKYFLYGFFIGVSFWFRFHFMIYSLLFPIVILISTHDKKSFFQAGLGVIASLAIPHILSYLTYNQILLGNQKFIIAQYFGFANWDYEFSQRIETMSIKEILQQSNLFISVVRNVIWFIENILFFVIIASFVNFKKIGSKKILIVFLSISIFILFFLFIRGYTYRLTLGLVVSFLLLIPFMEIYSLNRIILLASVLILYLFIPEAKLIRDNYRRIREHRYIYNKVSQTIELSKTSDNEILALGEMYNFSNRNLEYSENVQDGWIVRFEPVISRYKLIDIHNLYREDVQNKIREYNYVIQKKTDFNYKKLDLGKDYDIAYSDNIIDIFEKRNKDSD